VGNKAEEGKSNRPERRKRSIRETGGGLKLGKGTSKKKKNKGGNENGWKREVKRGSRTTERGPAWQSLALNTREGGEVGIRKAFQKGKTEVNKIPGM